MKSRNNSQNEPKCEEISRIYGLISKKRMGNRDLCNMQKKQAPISQSPCKYEIISDLRRLSTFLPDSNNNYIKPKSVIRHISNDRFGFNTFKSTLVASLRLFCRSTDLVQIWNRN